MALHCPITTLSAELYNNITESLNPLERIHLKLTSTFFYKMIAPLEPKELTDAQDLLYNRRNPCKQTIPGLFLKSGRKTYLACMSCDRLRPTRKFADDHLLSRPHLQVPKDLLRNYPHPRPRKINRICIECGLEQKKCGYRKTDVIEVEGRKYLVCTRCEKLGRTEKGTKGFARKICKKCIREMERMDEELEEETRQEAEEAHGRFMGN